LLPTQIVVAQGIPESKFLKVQVLVDNLRTPDQTSDSFLPVSDWKRGGKVGGFSPVDDDHEERGERETRVRVRVWMRAARWHCQKHVIH
jgi:hypothetical protein